MQNVVTLIAYAVICSLAVFADEPAPDPVPDPISVKSVIHLPTVPVTVEPNAPVNPQPQLPANVDKLNSGELYVIEHPTKLRVFESKPGFVKITTKPGPITLYARFADGIDRQAYEWRTCSAAYVYVVEPLQTGQISLLLLDSFDSDLIAQPLTVTVGPRPPPVDPIVDPVVPVVDPVVPTVGKLKIVIIEDPALRGSLTPAQISILDGQAVRQYAKTHCSVTDGTPDIRFLSFRQDVSGQPEWIKKAFAEPRSSMPFIAVSNGVTGSSGPLPATEAETLELLKKYGG